MLFKKKRNRNGKDMHSPASIEFAKELEQRYNGLLRTYKYVPSVNGGKRKLTDDEDLLLKYIVYEKLVEESLDPRDFMVVGGTTFWWGILNAPVTQCGIVKTKGKVRDFGLEVVGLLTSPGRVNFCCFNENKDGLVGFATAREAMKSPLTIPKKQA